jgi:hypothetical protein
MAGPTRRRVRWWCTFSSRSQTTTIKESCRFHRERETARIQRTICTGALLRSEDFFQTAATGSKETASTFDDADLVAYVGHDGLMDFQVPALVGAKDRKKRHFIILACASKPFFQSYMKQTGSEPLLWTTGLMAPEAYILRAALSGWFAGENAESIRVRAAKTCDHYQNCGEQAARRIFASGW